MWRDPFAVFCGALASVWVRLVLFVASMLLGGLAGSILAGADFVDRAGGISFFAALFGSVVALAVLIATESARVACLALAMNGAAWCWIVAIFARALGQA